MPAATPPRLLVLLMLSLAGASDVHAAQADVQPRSATPRSTDVVTGSLEPLLAGEFALQAGQLDVAARHYLDAARSTRDGPLAERATRIALLAKDEVRAAEALQLWKSYGTPGAALQAAEASLLLRRGQEPAAIEQLAALLKTPGDEAWKQALMVLGTDTRDPAQAARVLRVLVDTDRMPQDLQAWMAFGGLAQRLEQPALVDAIVDRVVARFPGDPRVTLLRASQLREADKPDEARAALAPLRARAATDESLRLGLASEYDALGDFAAASAVLSAGPQDEQTYGLRASLLARSEDTAALTALYDEIAKGADRPDPQRRLLLGQIAEFLKRYDDALQWYAGVPGGPQRWVARLRSANALNESGRGAQALKDLAALQAEAAAPEDVRRDAYVLEASLRQKAKDNAGELEAFERGLAAFPDDPEILYARALGWERRDDVARAEADFRKILVAEPDNVATLNALGYTLADRTQRFTEALELIQRARTAEPGNAAIIDSYGWVLYRLGKPKEAAVELRRALALQKDAEIAAHLGEVLWVLGQRDEARRYFEQARKIDPDNRALQRAVERFKP